ncbi:hypothetical protein SD421_09070 [Qipengyuania sp. HL-TH1]|uniref:hypothetical protein n=1 Tax=Qipengyuania profunda TaxID=3113984 RepID=UPI002A189381|nr:hypothetical protein [Qipengyuania sp. HL-TH1]WPL55632.1 hypothetical protein SD421_09070 [Qipengyuania sp. HL-TH5]
MPELYASTLVPVGTALKSYYQVPDTARGGMTRFAYRNYVVASYTSAIDKRYRTFTDQLRSGGRGSALGFGLLQLGLTGATALAKEADVSELATITAIATGAGAVVDENVFFDRTMPAIIAAMDAERAGIKTDIARKKALSADRYSLDEAIDDLDRLQRAGRLDRALARITRAAEADRVAQEEELNAITSACDDISVLAAPLNERFRNLVGTQDGENPELRQTAASVLRLEVEPGTVPTWAGLREAFDQKLCDDTEKENFLDDLEKSQPGEEGI